MDINKISQRGMSYPISFFFGEMNEVVNYYELPYGLFLLGKTSEEYELFYGVNNLEDLIKGIEHVKTNNPSINFIFRYAIRFSELIKSRDVLGNSGYKEYGFHVGYRKELTEITLKRDNHIVQITPEDINKLMSIEKEVFDSFNITREEYDKWLSEENVILAYQENGEYLGFIILLIIGNGRNNCFLRNLGVKENMRGKKIGEKLLLEALNTAYKKGITKSMLWVEYSNTIARNLYEKVGYKIDENEAEIAYLVK